MTDTLIILSAVESEFLPLYEYREELSRRWKVKTIFETVGIGAINSAAGMEKTINKYPSGDFLLIGTCGVYGNALPLMEPVTPVRHLFGGANLAGGRAYFPSDIYPELKTPAFGNFNGCSCLTTIGITTDPADAERLPLFYKTEIEHLESYPVISVALRYHRNIRAVLIPVNRTGPNAHEEYMQNASEGVKILTEKLLKREIRL